MKNGYSRTVSDPCLFVRVVDDIRTYVWCHVDDTFVCTTHSEELKRFHDLMSLQFTVTQEPNVSEYLGMKLDYSIPGKVK